MSINWARLALNLKTAKNGAKLIDKEFVLEDGRAINISLIKENNLSKVAKFFKALSKDELLAYNAYFNGKVIGIADIRRKHATNQNSLGEIGYAVKQGFGGTGLSYLLLYHVLISAKRKGIKWVFARIDKNNSRSIGFIRNIGGVKATKFDLEHNKKQSRLLYFGSSISKLINGCRRQVIKFSISKG